MSGLNPVTSDIAVSCCYFETWDETSVHLETYIQEVFPEGNVFNNSMYIIIKFLLAIFFSLWLSL